MNRNRTAAFGLLYYKVPKFLKHIQKARNFCLASLAAEVPQRSPEWFELRKNKLTCSSFSTALGFWKGRRVDLWREKVFAITDPSLESNPAVSWGTKHESVAIERYKSITGRGVSQFGFATHLNEEEYGWLGASPDGLLSDDGILEVKCPYNKGKPELGLPWKTVPYYYIPQVQGLMEIMDKEWLDLYCWNPTASRVFRVDRNRDYWGLICPILKEFWSENVAPGRQAFLLGKLEDVEKYTPAFQHRDTKLIIAKSMSLAYQAKVICKEIAGHLEFDSV